MRPLFRSFHLLLLPLLCLLALTGCAHRPPQDFAAQYLAALERFPASTTADLDTAMQHFVDVFTHMTATDIRERVARTYASDLFFNDTLYTATQREALADHLAGTGQAMDAMQVEILGWTAQDGEVYVRWLMHTRFSMAGRDVDARTIGMTHLRFNDAGQVVLHQDFWDSSQGFLEHVPVLGGMIRWVRSRL
ncbi:hypothetical protein S7S_13020 [Isoalcanivorax pacificus W11-5]|uniref:SnoaL-like domain-containing protein n=1 Tax=Isoalcanivorax pacificus W11-5 TaxID=391936 RepID=A0A0B4XPF8_9GAMM|nr:nuclear transport factor 2 family protein [Isoalcanivorax pacificus]AJD49016.1 hypothetical protein S7S_13020 [Isoalcanivorax pacificus W11-5]